MASFLGLGLSLAGLAWVNRQMLLQWDQGGGGPEPTGKPDEKKPEEDAEDKAGKKAKTKAKAGAKAGKTGDDPKD